MTDPIEFERGGRTWRVRVETWDDLEHHGSPDESHDALPADLLAAGYIPQPPEPGEAAKGGGVSHEEARDAVDGIVTALDDTEATLSRYIDQQEAAESERDALQRRVEESMGHLRADVRVRDEELKARLARITVLEAALVQAETERARLRTWLTEQYEDGDKVNVYTVLSFLASPTRSASAEARSDGEGQEERCGLHYGDRRCFRLLGHEPPCCTVYDCISHHCIGAPAQPPQPVCLCIRCPEHGYADDPAKKLLSLIVGALRSTEQPGVHGAVSYGFQVLADRLERKA